MNTTIENQTVVTKKRTGPRPAAAPEPVVVVEDLVGKRPASEVSRLVFMVLLAAAACIALVGVVAEAGTTGTSPDDPAPEVIVNVAD